MTCLDFIDKYCEKNDLILDRKLNGTRLCGQRLVQIKLLSYLLKTYFNKSHTESSRLLQIPRQSSFIFYYNVLENKTYRRMAEERYKEITNNGNI